VAARVSKYEPVIVGVVVKADTTVEEAAKKANRGAENFMVSVVYRM